MGHARGRSLLAGVALLSALCGCSGTDEPRSAPPASSPTPTPEPPPSPDPVWSLDDARVDQVPADPPLVESALPTTFPADDAVLPDLLADPPGRARLTYHPRETFDDIGGWVAERVFFLGTDGGWRSLEMVDLGLPESSHPGVDTYGAGELSPDGTRWATKTNDGIVVLDLATGSSKVVALPGRYTDYLSWRPDGRRIGVVRSARRWSFLTWTVGASSLAPTRAYYDLPIDGFAHDGSVHAFGPAEEGSIRVVHRARTGAGQVVPLPYRLARGGGAVGPTRTTIGLRRGLLVVDNATTEALARLRLGPRDGVAWPRGWWAENSFWFYEDSRGLLTWNVATGEVGTLTRVRPGTRRDGWWTTSVAVDLMR